MKICARFFVSGKVQGVWFRAWTREQARQLGVRGYAKNLADGRVEVLACGEQDTVAELCQRLWRGPDLARVSEIVEEPVQYREIQGFDIV